MQILKLINQKFNQVEERSTIIQSKKLERKKDEHSNTKPDTLNPTEEKGGTSLELIDMGKDFLNRTCYQRS